MNLKNPNLDELKELLRNCDDKKFNHILWVTKNGDVNVNKFTTANPSHQFEINEAEDLLFWKGVFYSGNKYVGEEAANDQVYIENLLDELLKSWKIKYQGHLNN